MVFTVNTSKLPNNWKKDKNTAFYTVAKVSLMLQYISFFLSLLIAGYMIYMGVTNMKFNKKLSDAYFMSAIALVLFSFLLLKIVQMNPTAAVAVLSLNVLMFVVREDVIQRVMRMLRL